MPDAFSAMGLDASDMDLTHVTEVSKTDDTGAYRVAGLAGGDYVLQARLTAGALGHSSLNPSAGNAMMANLMGIKLTVYSGNVTRQADARPVSVRAGEERTGYDLQEPLHLLHSIGGIVRSKADGHPVSAGNVQGDSGGRAGQGTIRPRATPPAWGPDGNVPHRLHSRPGDLLGEGDRGGPTRRFSLPAKSCSAPSPRPRSTRATAPRAQSSRSTTAIRWRSSWMSVSCRLPSNIDC